MLQPHDAKDDGQMDHGPKNDDKTAQADVKKPQGVYLLVLVPSELPYKTRTLQGIITLAHKCFQTLFVAW